MPYRRRRPASQCPPATDTQPTTAAPPTYEQHEHAHRQAQRDYEIYRAMLARGYTRYLHAEQEQDWRTTADRLEHVVELAQCATLAARRLQAAADALDAAYATTDG